jgi:hypothetical protein
MKKQIMEKHEDAYLDDYDDYDDFEEIEEEPEELLATNLLKNIEISSIDDFRKDAMGLAEYYIKLFFEEKSAHPNANLEKSSLSNKDKICTVVNTNIIAGVQKAYEALEKCIVITQEDINIAKKNGDVTQEIKMVNETLKSLYKAGVPQQFAGGMMLLCLEFCEGIYFGS